MPQEKFQERWHVLAIDGLFEYEVTLFRFLKHSYVSIFSTPPTSQSLHPITWQHEVTLDLVKGIQKAKLPISVTLDGPMAWNGSGRKGQLAAEVRRHHVQ